MAFVLNSLNSCSQHEIACVNRPATYMIRKNRLFHLSNVTFCNRASSDEKLQIFFHHQLMQFFNQRFMTSNNFSFFLSFCLKDNPCCSSILQYWLNMNTCWYCFLKLWSSFTRFLDNVNFPLCLLRNVVFMDKIHWYLLFKVQNYVK